MLNPILEATANDDILIMASSACKVDKMSKKLIRKVFLGKQHFIDTQVVTVLDNKNPDIYKDFVYLYLDKTPKMMKAYQMRMLFTGKQIPPKTLNIKALESYKNTVCYISYVSRYKKIKNWKVVYQ